MTPELMALLAVCQMFRVVCEGAFILNRFPSPLLLLIFLIHVGDTCHDSMQRIRPRPLPTPRGLTESALAMSPK